MDVYCLSYKIRGIGHYFCHEGIRGQCSPMSSRKKLFSSSQSVTVNYLKLVNVVISVHICVCVINVN